VLAPDPDPGDEVAGQADALNLEMGYAWTLGGGLNIEPQFQYTRTKVDNIDTLSTATRLPKCFETFSTRNSVTLSPFAG